MTKIAIFPASGIGDCLILSTMARALQHQGFIVTCFSNHGIHFGTWLSDLRFSPTPSLEEIAQLPRFFDMIFLQHDNSLKAKAIEKLPLPLYRFYGSHLLQKHGPLHPTSDYVCNPNLSMVENLNLAANRFFDLFCPLQTNISPPQGALHRKFIQRIAIHPTASSFQKCWPREKFFILKENLEKAGFSPVFITPPEEQLMWDSPLLPTLEDLATFLYESGGFIGNDSGPGHLASLLQIPHLIIGGDGGQMPLWKPGWHPGTLLLPPKIFMRYKALRKRWHYFIKPEDVLYKFINCCF